MLLKGEKMEMIEGVIMTVDTEEEVTIAVVEEVMIVTTTAIGITIDVAGEFFFFPTRTMDLYRPEYCK
jgi:hypothetical protein